MKIYIGNLSQKTTEEELNDLFSQVGTINSLQLIKDRYTGESRGFAFLEFADQSNVDTAISQFDGFKVSGSNMIVNQAREKSDRNTNRRSW